MNIPYAIGGAAYARACLFDYIPPILHTPIKKFQRTDDVAPYIRDSVDDSSNFASICVPKGRFCVGSGVVVTKGIHFVGESRFSSIIDPLDSFNPLEPQFTFKPNPLVNCTGAGLTDLYIGRISANGRAGAEAVLVDTLVQGAYAPQFQLSRVYMGQGSGPAFRAANDSALNKNGGLAVSKFSETMFKGGAVFDKVGDTITLDQCIFLGTGALDVNLTQGATEFAIDRASVSLTGGVIFRNGYAMSLTRSTIELLTATTNDNACLIDVIGGATLDTLNIEKCSLYAGKDANIQRLIRVNQALATTIEKNRLAAELAGMTGIAVTSAATDTRLFKNKPISNIAQEYTDAGAGTVYTAF